MSESFGWICKGGDPSNPSKCDPICGDGLQRGDETCDDGKDDDIGCNSTCTGFLKDFNCTQFSTEEPAICCTT